MISIPVIFGIFGYNRYYNHNGNETAYDQIKSDLEWSLARVPNLDELITMSYPLAIANIFIEPFMERLYQINPIAKAVVRDWTKIPSSIVAWWSGNEIGGTHIKYDEGNVYGGITKTLCKSSIIGMHANFNYGLDGGDLEKISRISNYICEPTSRVYNLISKEKQIQNNTETSYFEFARMNTDAELLIQASAEGLTKNLVADQIGNFFGQLGVFKLLKTIYITIENKFIYVTVGAVANGDFLHHRMETVHAATANQYFKKAIVMPSLIGIDFCLKALAEAITSFIITPTVRMAQDGIGIIVKESWEYWEHKESESIENIASSDLSTETDNSTNYHVEL
jgi:hypothetical protein